MSKEKKSHQKQKSEDTRLRLISTACRMFAVQGIEAVGVRDIVKEAGVTTGAFYYHFQSKSDLILAYYEENDKSFTDTLLYKGQEMSYCDHIVNFFVSELAEVIVENGQEFTRYRMLEMKVYSDQNTRLYNNLLDLIVAAQNCKEIDPTISADEIIRYIFIVFRGVLYHWCVVDCDLDLKKEMKFCISLAIKSLKLKTES